MYGTKEAEVTHQIQVQQNPLAIKLFAISALRCNALKENTSGIVAIKASASSFLCAFTKVRLLPEKRKTK